MAKWKLASLYPGIVILQILFVVVVMVFIGKSLQPTEQVSGGQPALVLTRSLLSPGPDVASRTDCEAIFRNDPEAIRSAVVRQDGARPPLADGDFVRLCADCDEFRRRAGFVTRPVNDEEAAFPISYSIVAYKDVEQVARLLRSVYRPQNYYCIHVDRSSPADVRRGLAAVASCFDNVDTASRSVDVRYGEWSLVEAELVCMRDHLRYPDWTYHVNLAGQELPLKTNLEIVRVLKAANGSNIMYRERDTSRSRTRFTFIYEGLKRLRRRTAKEMSPPHGIRPVKGSFLSSVTRQFVHFIFTSKAAEDFAEWTKRMLIPDETYFVSLHFNSHLHAPGSYQGNGTGSTTINRFVIWSKEEPRGVRCHGKFVRRVCVLSVGDLFQLYDAPEMFANKFYLDQQPLAYWCMEELIRNRTAAELRTGNVRSDFNVTFYEQFDFVKNHA